MKIHKRFNNRKEIIKLKADLMGKRRFKEGNNREKGNNSSRTSRNIATSFISTKTISSKITEIINEEKGKLFESNIRKTLEFEFTWKQFGEREFYYRRVICNGNDYILTPYCPIKINTNIVEYELKLENNGDCLISNGFEKSKLEGDTDYNLNIDKGILIEKKQYIEMDGFYGINEIKFPLFNPEEVTIIYNSFENDLKEFKYIIIVIKMNQKK